MFLYKFYDEQEALLYVGITGNPAHRFKQHAWSKSWWGDVVRHELDELPDKEARKAERLAIRDLQPAYNVWRPTTQPIAADDDLVRQVGTRLKNQLILSGLTQGDLAISLNVDRSTISRYLAGEVSMSLTQLDRIARLLDCEPCTFLGCSPEADQS